MNTRTRLALVVASQLAGIVAIVAVAIGTLRAVQVTGPLYRHVLLGKDLLADVLPPPMYVVEACSQALLLAREPDGARRRALLDELARLERELGASRARWEKELDDPALRGLVVDEASGRAASFFRVVRDELVPAVDARDQAAVGRALGAAAREYQGQRAAIDQIVQRTEARDAADEAQARSLATRSTEPLPGATSRTAVRTS